MIGYYVLTGGLVLAAGIITLMDWLGRRQRERRERTHKS
jgi:hypothetical protein